MKKPTILIVDDSRPILCLLEVILGKKFEVFAVTDGFMAINWLQEGNKPDLIITDLQMPNIDWREFISHLSNSIYYDNIPVLVLSGSDENEILKYCERLKIAGYLTKPFDPVELIDKIRGELPQESMN